MGTVTVRPIGDGNGNGGDGDGDGYGYGDGKSEADWAKAGASEVIQYLKGEDTWNKLKNTQNT
jgi:hypothetical protein